MSKPKPRCPSCNSVMMTPNKEGTLMKCNSCYGSCLPAEVVYERKVVKKKKKPDISRDADVTISKPGAPRLYERVWRPLHPATREHRELAMLTRRG